MRSLWFLVGLSAVFLGGFSFAGDTTPSRGFMSAGGVGGRPCNKAHPCSTTTVSSTTVLVTTSTTTVGGSPSGQPMPVGDLPGWRQLVADDFTTPVALGSFPGYPATTPDGKWSAYPYGWKDTSKNGSYWPAKGLSVRDGVLDIWPHTENGVHIAENPFPILPGKAPFIGQLYGRYTVRFKADPVPGYKTAWLLWPDSDTWPRDGEIDFPEGDLTGNICAFMHRQNGTSGSDQDGYCTATPEAGAWHTATIEWLSSRVTFLLDGVKIGESTARIPATAMHWVLQTETQLSGGAPADTASGHVLVDWVAVYTPV